jgi:hypothetical protein
MPRVSNVVDVNGAVSLDAVPHGDILRVPSLVAAARAVIVKMYETKLCLVSHAIVEPARDTPAGFVKPQRNSIHSCGDHGKVAVGNNETLTCLLPSICALPQGQTAWAFS